MKYKGKSIEAIGSKMLFGKETLWIHILEDDSFAQVLRSDLEEDMPSNSQAGMSYVRYIAIAARIKEEMAQKRLPAPYESSLILLPHQILILEKVMQRVQTRFMLADEVGMARTFAGVAVKEELNFRKRHNQIIVSLDVPKPVSQRQGWSQEKINDYNKYRIESVVSAGFDMIIIDKARYCIKNEQDVKTTALIRKITQLRKEKGDAQLKVLVFIEFRKVQEYLTKQIERAGLTTVCINGSMDLQKRQRALVKFKNEANVMIATDAAGESLNMQFCHIVFNYDLPWNPMAIEQRIGRVDQYGQKHPVTAFNMLTDNTADTPGYLTIWKVIAKNSNEIKTTYSAQFITDSGKFFAPYRKDVV
ncbi:MAG: hypothetical protein J6K31_03520 [Parabacteroides sp.]|nr:hypothetical protein [Parabacteroides sp.]